MIKFGFDYKKTARACFKGIDWDNLAEVAIFEKGAEKAAEKYLMVRREWFNSEKLFMQPAELVPLQEETIRNLIKEVTYYKSLATMLSVKLQDAKD